MSYRSLNAVLLFLVLVDRAHTERASREAMRVRNGGPTYLDGSPVALDFIERARLSTLSFQPSTSHP